MMAVWKMLTNGGIPTRYTVAIVAFFNLIYVYMLRLNVNIVLVAMINYTGIPHTNITPAEECGHLIASSNETTGGSVIPFENGEFEWDEQVQSLISGSFFWGYLATQLVGGRVAERLGSKYLVAGAQCIVCLVTLCLPVLARSGVELFIVGRVLLGLAQGLIVPSMQPLVAKWGPSLERNSMSAFIFSGSQVGTILGTIFGGMMANVLGWESVFYIEGGLAVVVILPWLYFVYDSPRLHPRISDSECAYIESSTTARQHNKNQSLPAVPWKSIATSMPCWALLIATLGNNWAFYMLLVQLPIYMKTILGLDLKTNALLSALPWLVMWLFSVSVARMADWATKSGRFSVNFIRKAANTLGHCGPAACLVAVSFLGCDRLWTLVLLTVSIGLMGAAYSGYLVNHLDLSPNFAGTVYGLISSLSSINSWLAPLVVATLTDGRQTLAQWRIAFLLCAAILVVDAAIFIIFGSTERQEWDKIEVAGSQKQENIKESNVLLKLAK